MIIRKAGYSDIDSIVENRLEFMGSLYKEEQTFSEEFINDTYEYLKENIVKDTFVAWIAKENASIVSIAVVCFYDLLPMMSNKTGKTGYILNVYTLPEYRRMGLATTLINHLIEEARGRNVHKLMLSATEEGMHVYKKMGFHVLVNEMALNIP